MFGDFLNRGKHGQLDFENIDDLEDGTPIVARYNNREFQFGIYGEGYVIYQDCWQTKAGVLVFSLEQSSIEGFFEDSTVYDIRPILNLIKRKRIIMQDAISRSREIVYGDDFTLMCMLDSIETHHFRHLVLAYACSFAVSCLK
jgi:hypothetical protein